MGALAGRLIWAAHFLLIYGFAALACARGFADVRLLGAGVVPLIVGAATAVAILAAAAMLLLALLGPGKEDTAARGGPRFLRWMTALVSGLSLVAIVRSEEHTSELQSLMRISYAVFCLQKANQSQLHARPTLP